MAFCPTIGASLFLFCDRFLTFVLQSALLCFHGRHLISPLSAFQCLVNLGVNAVKYTDKGSVTLRADMVTAEACEVCARVCVCVCVCVREREREREREYV